MEWNVGNPLYIFDTNLGYGATSIDRTGSDSAVVGVGTTFLDNIYIIQVIQTPDQLVLLLLLLQVIQLELQLQWVQRRLVSSLGVNYQELDRPLQYQ